jgi:transposase-like protein
LYRTVDKYGETIDFLLTEHRDTEAALCFLKKAIRRHGVPKTTTIDGSDANEAAIKRYNEEQGTNILPAYGVGKAPLCNSGLSVSHLTDVIVASLCPKPP